MKLLIVSATKFEIEPILKSMSVQPTIDNRFMSCTYKNHHVDFLIAGIGMVSTTFYLTKALSKKYDLVINAGICGSFNRNIDLGSVLNIYEDTFSELGAEDGDSFLTLAELNLQGIQTVQVTPLPFKNNSIELLPKVTGITVNTTHGKDESINTVVNKFHPYTESMEGAAFIFVCEQEKTPCIQIRAVSNYVERRNKENWNIPLAIENLTNQLIAIINELN